MIHRRSHTRQWTLILTAMVALCCPHAFGGSGDLDQRFGMGGQTTANLHTVHGEAAYRDVAIQADGKIVCVGDAEYAHGRFLVQRWLADGSPDQSFGDGGLVLTSFAIGSGDEANTVALQSDGKIVVGGGSDLGPTQNPALARYNSDGTLDASFGDGGLVTTTLGTTYSWVAALAIQGDGKIVTAVTNIIGWDYEIVVLRFLADGSLDPSFSDDGLVVLDLSSTSDHDWAFDLILQEDGKILVAGFADERGALVRLDPNGDLDSSFDGDGIVLTNFSDGSAEFTSVTVQDDGKIVGAGYRYASFNGNFLIARYNVDGTPDTTFGDQGVSVLDFGGWDRVEGVAIQSDGKIAVAGHLDLVDGSLVAMARLHGDGSTDLTWTTDFGATRCEANALAMQDDGKLVVVGEARVIERGVNRPAVARFANDSSLDDTFDGDGLLTTLVSVPSHDHCHAMALQDDGMIVSVGHVEDENDDLGWFGLIRLRSDGSVDTTFGLDGVVLTAFPGFEGASAHDVAIMEDGRIVAVGAVYNEETEEENFAVALYHPDGSLDTTFDGDGLGITHLSETDVAKAVVVQDDGRIVVGGTATGQWALVRYNLDGTLDGSFGQGGIVLTPLEDARIEDMVLQPDGKIIVTGPVENESGVARYLPNGDLEWSTILDFDDPSARTKLGAVTLQQDGKILVAGSTDIEGHDDFAVARLLPFGVRDTDFDTDGYVTADFGGTDDRARALTVSSGGHILVGGYVKLDDDDFALMALRSDGSVDTQFQSSGWMITDFHHRDDEAEAMLLQPDGFVLLSGTVEHEGRDFGFARYWYEPNRPRPSMNRLNP